MEVATAPQPTRTATRLPALDIARVVAIAFVMLIHSNISDDAKQAPLLFLLKDYLTAGAVPLFFLISGYLGAKKINDPSVRAGDFLLEKCRTLLVPFLSWSCLTLVAVFAAKALRLDAFTHGGGAYYDVQPTLSSCVTAIFGIQRSTIAYHLWFIRDLFIASAASFFLIRWVPAIPLLAWLLFAPHLHIADSLALYLLGYSLHSLPTALFSPKTLSCLLFMALWLGLGLMKNFFPFPLEALGCAAFLYYASVVFSRFELGNRIALWGPATFWIYAIHEPTLTILSKSWQLAKFPWYGSAISFLGLPCVIFVGGLLTHRLLRRHFPAALPLLTGGR